MYEQIFSLIASENVSLVNNEAINVKSKNNINNANNVDVNNIKIINANNDIEAVQIWLQQYYAIPATFANYRKEAERFLLWCLKHNKRLKNIMFEDVLSFRQFCLNPQPTEQWVSSRRYPRAHKNWRPFSSCGLSIASIKLVEITLNNMFNWLCNAGYLIKNPFKLRNKNFGTDKNNNKSPNKFDTSSNDDNYDNNELFIHNSRYIDEDLMRAIFNYLQHNLEFSDNNKNKQQSIRDKWLISLLYLTGMRISELINNTMHSFKQIVDKKTGNIRWWLQICGKGGKIRAIPVAQKLISLMQIYREQVLGLEPLPQLYENIPLIAKIQQMNVVSIQRACLHNWVKDIFLRSYTFIMASSDYANLHDKAHIIKQASAHWIRHSTWTHMANHGVDIRFIRDNAGHSSIATTNIYLHSEDVERHEASLNLAAHINI